MATDVKLGSLAVDRYNALFTARTDDSFGRVQIRGTLTVDDLINYMLKTGTEISETTLRASIDLFEKTKADRLFEGFAINTPTVRMYPTCQGTFIGEHPVFERPKQRILIQCTQGSMLRAGCEKVNVIVNQMMKTGPFINKVFDTFTDEMNGAITKGNTIRCEGHKLTITGTDENVGFYLVKVDVTPEKRIKVDPRNFAVNQPSQLIVTVPADLEDGDYRIEIITQYSGNSKLPAKAPYTYRFDPLLTVDTSSQGGGGEGGGDDVLE